MTTPPKPLSDDELREEVLRVFAFLEGAKVSDIDPTSVVAQSVDEIMQMFKAQAALREREVALKTAERCWAEVHPAEKGWHRVGDIVEELTHPPRREERPMSTSNTNGEDTRYFTPLHHAIAAELGYKQTPTYASWDKTERTAPVQVIDRLVHFIQANYIPLSNVVEAVGEDQPETWFNKDLVKVGNEYERKFITKEAPKRYRNKLRAEIRAKLGLTQQINEEGSNHGV
jgi:hypothetical protein